MSKSQADISNISKIQFGTSKNKIKSYNKAALLLVIRHMHQKKLKGLSLGFQFFEYLSFEFEYFANLKFRIR